MYLKLIFIMYTNLFLTKKKQSLIYICKMLQIFQITSVSNCWNECHQLLLRLSCHEPALLMFHSKYKIWWMLSTHWSLVTHTCLSWPWSEYETPLECSGEEARSSDDISASVLSTILSNSMLMDNSSHPDVLFTARSF